MLHNPTLTPPDSNPTASGFLRRATDGFQTATANDINSSDQTIPLASTNRLSDDTAVTLCIEPGTDKQEFVAGFVAGSNIINCYRGLEGTATDHAASSVVIMISTASDHNGIIDFLQVGHTHTGGHKAFTDSDLVSTATIQNGAVTLAKMAAGSVDYTKLASNLFGSQLQTYTPTVTTIGGGISSLSSITGNYINLGGFKLAWGFIGYSNNAAQGHLSWSFPASFFTTVTGTQISVAAESNFAFQTVSGDGWDINSMKAYINSSGNGGGGVMSFLAIGA